MWPAVYVFAHMHLLVALALAAQPWTLDVEKTELVVKVWKTGAAASLAHDHVIRAGKVTGAVQLDDEARPESLALELVVDVASLVPDEPEVKKRHLVGGPAVPEGDRAKVRENMLGSEQLDAAKFPTIRFVVTQVTRDAQGAWQCAGRLTLHGVTKELKFPITVSASGPRVVGEAKVRVRTSDFGVAPFSAALGLIRNKDEVELVAHVEAVRP